MHIINFNQNSLRSFDIKVIIKIKPLKLARSIIQLNLMEIQAVYNVSGCVKSYRDKLNDKRHPCSSPTTSLLIEMTLDDGVCVCARNDNTVNIPHALSSSFQRPP